MNKLSYHTFEKRLLETMQCDLSKDISLCDHTWYKTGGKTDFLIYPHNEEELKQILILCDELEIPKFILGGGANVLVSDNGFRGVIIKLSRYLNTMVCKNNQIEVEAGADLQQLIIYCEGCSLGGLQYLSGIPGTVGGALMMNAGTDKGEIGNVVTSVKVIDPQFNTISYSADQIDFCYRYVPQLEDKVILSSILTLTPQPEDELKTIRRELISLRKKKQPLEYPSCGSVFKRPKGNYAGKLIDDLGLKGLRQGDAIVSEKHAGFIVNLGKATSTDIKILIDKVQKLVMQHYGIMLEPEVRFLGF